MPSECTGWVSSYAPVIMSMVSSLGVVLTILTMVHTQDMVRKMTIAAIFDEGGDRKHELAFRHAVQAVNRNR